jgi:excisionase family DNA binding protein
MSDNYPDPLDAIQGEFVTTRQAADILDVQVNTVTYWCRAGLIASRRLGGRYRIPKWVIRNMRRVRMPATTAVKPFLKLSEAAPLLHIHPNTLQKWCSKGKIPCRRVGSRYELSRRVVDQLMEESQEQYRGTGRLDDEWDTPVLWDGPLGRS